MSTEPESHSLLGNLRRKLPEDCLEGEPLIGYMLSGSVDMTSQGSPSEREEIKRTPDQNKMVYSSGIGMNIEKNELEINGKKFVFGDKTFKALGLLFERINTYVPSEKLCVAVHEEGKDEDGNKIFSQAKCPIHPVSVHEEDEDWNKTFLQMKCPIEQMLGRLRRRTLPKTTLEVP
jgi:hypothetical protein